MYISLTFWVYCYHSKANYYENYHLMTSLTKLRRKPEKTCEMILASPSASHTRGLASDFKARNQHLINSFHSLLLLNFLYQLVRKGAPWNHPRCRETRNIWEIQLSLFQNVQIICLRILQSAIYNYKAIPSFWSCNHFSYNIQNLYFDMELPKILEIPTEPPKKLWCTEGQKVLF